MKNFQNYCTYYSLTTLVSVFLSFFFSFKDLWSDFLSLVTLLKYIIYIYVLIMCAIIKRSIFLTIKRSIYLCRYFHSIQILASPPIWSTGATLPLLEHTSLRAVPLPTFENKKIARIMSIYILSQSRAFFPLYRMNS